MGKALLVLVGFAALIQPNGSLMQLVVAVAVCLVHLTLQVSASPYADLGNNYLAVASSPIRGLYKGPNKGPNKGPIYIYIYIY